MIHIFNISIHILSHKLELSHIYFILLSRSNAFYLSLLLNLTMSKRHKRGISLTHQMNVKQEANNPQIQNDTGRCKLQYNIAPKKSPSKSLPKQPKLSFTYITKNNNFVQPLHSNSSQREAEPMKNSSGEQRINHHFANYPQKHNQPNNIEAQQEQNNPKEMAHKNYANSEYLKLVQRRRLAQYAIIKDKQLSLHSSSKTCSTTMTTMRSSSKKKAEENLLTLDNMKNRLGTIINACSRKFK